MDINYWIVPGVLIILLAGFVQGVTSFGFALISLPLLTLFLPLQQVVPLIVILSLLTNIAILFNCYKHVINGLLNKAVVSALSWMIPAMIVGVVLGIWAGSKINEKIFKRLVLVLIMVSGVWTIVTGL